MEKHGQLPQRLRLCLSWQALRPNWHVCWVPLALRWWVQHRVRLNAFVRSASLPVRQAKVPR